MATHQRRLKDSIHLLILATHRIPLVSINLDNAAPGFPTSVIGASPPSGQSAEPDGLNMVERLATRPDPALEAERRIKSLVGRIESTIDELERLTAVWCYAAHTPAPTPDKDFDPGDWCRSCVRIQKFEPPYRDGACRWCYEHRHPDGSMPTIAELNAHHLGVRVPTKAAGR